MNDGAYYVMVTESHRLYHIFIMEDGKTKEVIFYSKVKNPMYRKSYPLKVLK